jgi:hypothetical protein
MGHLKVLSPGQKDAESKQAIFDPAPRHPEVGGTSRPHFFVIKTRWRSAMTPIELTRTG